MGFDEYLVEFPPEGDTEGLQGDGGDLRSSMSEKSGLRPSDDGERRRRHRHGSLLRGLEQPYSVQVEIRTQPPGHEKTHHPPDLGDSGSIYQTHGSHVYGSEFEIGELESNAADMEFPS